MAGSGTSTSGGAWKTHESGGAGGPGGASRGLKTVTLISDPEPNGTDGCMLSAKIHRQRK